MERFTLKAQISFYKQWCHDNNKVINDINSLNEYINEIKELEGGN